MTAALVTASAAHLRLARAQEWLRCRARDEELLVVGASLDAANEMLRGVAAERGSTFGWQRATLAGLAARLAQPVLLARSLVPVGALVSRAVAARVVHRLHQAGGLGRYAPVGELPGFARATAALLGELRMADAESAVSDTPELAQLLDGYAEELANAGLADRAMVYRAAVRAAQGQSAAWLERPLLLLDVPLPSALEARLVEVLAARSRDSLATLPAGDRRTREALLRAGFRAEEPAPVPRAGSLHTLQSHLFEAAKPPEAALDDEVVLFNAPGESRECVEIARRLLALARQGTAFDRMAVLLRSPEEYRPHLVEAFARARLPAHFARGVVQPDPAGRAFLALLACADAGLSARRFAEYLSLAQVPDATAAGAPPAPAAAGERWVAPDEELVPDAVARALEPTASEPETLSELPEQAAVRAGSLRAPRRWEQLLVDAAVIGGRDRWQRRLEGLARELESAQAELEDPQDPAFAQLARRRADLASLRDYALPLLDALAALPVAASWRVWLDALSALATRALRRPERVLSVLAELAPMAEVGPVGLSEVQLVLSRRLLELAVPPAASRYGKVFVAPIDAARGLCFDVVCAPGLAERLFPRKICEEPILLDAVRERLDVGLDTNVERVEAERLALRIAAGAARRRLLLSYPRLDLDQARPRVPSFYALEALRAAEGRLPGFEELKARAESEVPTRVGWPAPLEAADAIDEAEYDLAQLDMILRRDERESIGTARFLLQANPHLGRSLRFRARRWLRRWTQADGLLPGAQGELAAGAREALARQRLAQRSFSPTALEKFAVCPYRFTLHAVQRLAPREMPEAIDEMDPLQRGSLVHEVQFELFRELSARDLLPVGADGLEQAHGLLDAALDRVAARHREDLAPAIERVWQDGVASVRADLREWLRRSSEDGSGFVPWLFELAFGLPGRRERDPRSRDAAVSIDCGLQLRGSVDLVERAPGGRLRVTDHKTGRARVGEGDVVAGGSALQPVLYALAVEKLFPDDRVEAGRLYYCTSAGGFEERVVPLDESARASAAVLAEVVDAALAEPFLPAAPAAGACRWCDYAEVCGPYEELRASRKPADAAGMRGLRRLRELR